MPKCSIIGCGTRNRGKMPNVTLHRLPTIESKRNSWLEIIGVKNIDTARKYVFVCSLHFDESCFNRTMNIIKLRDDALPSGTLSPLASKSVSGILTERGNNQASASSQHQFEDVSPKENFIDLGPSTSTARDPLALNLPVHQEELGAIPKHGAADLFSTTFATPDIPIHALQIIKKLKQKCQKQAKKIKRLNEQVRRQRKKIANFSAITKELREKNLVNSEEVVLLVVQ